MRTHTAIGFRFTIYLLLYATFVLGMPAVHYATALMIALIVRHHRDGGGFGSRVRSVRLDALR